jgi:hypothetical protein
MHQGLWRLAAVKDEGDTAAERHAEVVAAAAPISVVVGGGGGSRCSQPAANMSAAGRAHTHLQWRSDS